ncbi:MAG: S53 family peptidase [Nocardioidaceae bacterium]|nr:S53 family peptidase [Nocardioidaceae bacterium]MCL2612413.1 S53 family peptidase [Nocardioidaceae bacterium]
MAPARKRAVAAATTLAAACALAGTVGLPGRADANGRHTLAGSVPSWANAGHRVGATPKGQAVTFRVYLPLQHSDQAAALATSVSTPGSADYGHFLTPAQFRSRFAPSSASVAEVKTWLKGQGFKVGAVPSNNKYVEASGTAAQAATTFDTSFAEYRVDGQQVRSNTAPLSVPSSLGVQAVIGLDQSQSLVQPAKTTPPPAAFVNAQPCSAYWGEKTTTDTPTPDGTKLPAKPAEFAPCGYAGRQLQGAYGMSGAIGSGNDGKGVTIGIIDAFASPYIASDAETYSQRHGLPSLKGHFTQLITNGSQNKPPNKKMDPQGWAGEETLDVEAAHTMAPGADIVYIGANNNGRDLDALMNKVVNNHLADIVSNSYGYSGEALPPGTIKPSLDTQVQAAAEGISLLFSSGDNGDETGGDPSAAPTPDWPASSPYVTAVGGTSMGIGADDQRIFETGWETARSTLSSDGTWSTPTYQYGSGGGTSRLFAQPSYQAGVVPTSMSQTYGGAPMRVVPDVSALGDPTTGMLVGETQAFPDGTQKYAEYRIGGTSLASPLYAGMLALAEQKAGHEFGLANPRLYAAASSSYDVTGASDATYPGAVRSDYVNSVDGTNGYSYTARWFDRGDLITLRTGPGYDDVTGVGSPNGQAWLDAVANQ